MTEKPLEKLKQRVQDLPNRAKLIVINNNDTLTIANGFLGAIKTMRKEIDDTFNPIIKKAFTAHKEAVAQKKRYEKPLIDAEKSVKLKIASYMREQEEIRRKKEEEARKAEEERQLMEKHAQILSDAGRHDAAEDAKKSIPAQKEYVPHEVPKLQGTGIRRIWKWRVVDESKIPREYLVVDSAKITRLVKSTKGQIRIPGIEIYSEDSVSASAS